MLLLYASLRCYTAARRTNKSSVFRVFLRFADWLSTLPPQPAIPAFGQASQETREWAGNPGFSCILFVSRLPTRQSWGANCR